MKDYIVTIKYSHESFNGYDHNDGTKDFEVKAINRKVAGKKALKLAQKEGGGYCREISYVKNKHDTHDWVAYS